MSSPSESITDIDEAGLNRKRERAQSVEPSQQQDVEEQAKETSDTTVSAPKKTKRDEDENTTSVSTIRRNMKDMTTTDKNENDDNMAEKDVLAKFAGKKSEDDDDWGEFAEEEEEEKPTEKKEEEKPKYTFGSTSGFGTKGWAATHQTIPTTTSKPTFGGFKSTSGFGAFKTATTTTAEDTTKDASSTTQTTTVPSFGSFAKATSSPFAAIAAASSNALSSSTSTESTSSTTTASNTEKDTNDSNGNFGEGAKLKVPNIKKQTEVKTGEEDEDTIYQTKAKLLVLDQASGNWKERGVGTFRINMKEEKDTIQTRLVMRTDSVFRLILNLLLFQGMKVFIMQEKFVRFAGFETETKEDGSVDTKLVSFALKLSNPTIAKEVCNQINDCIPTSSS